MADKTKQSDQEVETATQTESTETVVENKPVVDEVAETKTETPTVEASVLNCPECKGLGLVGNLEVAGRHFLCALCGGHGKV